MKFNKLFFAAVAFAAMAMVSCNPDEPTPVIPTPEDEEVAPEMPAISNPEAGKTTIAIYAEVCPRGAYLVGSNQGYNINDDALSFEAMNSAGAANWYVLTIDYAADLQVKAIARPSDEEVPFGWSYQWGPNFDADAPEPLVADESKNNTKILGGTGEFVFENQGEVKLANVADGGVVYVWVKNWKTSPIIEAKKLETCWLKSNLNGEDWKWYEMEAKGDGVFELEAVWGGSGCNISETEGGSEQWYALDHPKVTLDPNAAAGDKVKFTFTSEKGINGTLKIDLVEKGEPADPVEYLDEDYLYLLNEGTLTDINIYGWAPNKGDNNEIFGAWPGQRVSGDATSLTRVFSEKIVKGGEYKFIVNGTGGQTADPEWVVSFDDPTVHHTLKITADNQLIVVE